MKIRHKGKRKIKYTEEQTDRNLRTKTLDCKRCEAPNKSEPHFCPIGGRKCAKCAKPGHYAKSCRSTRKKHIAGEETRSTDADDWTPSRIRSIQQKIHSMGTNNRNGPPLYTITLVVINRPITFLINTGSPVTLIPKPKFNNTTANKSG